MLSTQFLLMRAKRLLIDGNAIAAAYFCSRAASLAATYGTPDQAAKCLTAARLCQEQAAAQIRAAC